ncbi:MAG: recombination protein O N-terminal domain-containing protein, partial [Clostridia bacterium]|nr:recombination protein O N-terminal domain-containing protein [Clostridia bacterium]
MDITTKAIALRATDIKEHDKYILLYSLEHGKISVHARGIRKPSAKL